ncbi:MAG: hypothetical protein Q9217_007032 [Psora testacea]
MTDNPATTMQDLLQEVQDSFERPLHIDSLLNLSKQLQAELRQHLISSPQCMLPSFNYTLPTGQEQGTYLAVEVGGSNLRMALVVLHGQSRGGKDRLQIRQTSISPISREVRKLAEYAFFDWMAGKIREMLVLEGETRENDEPLRMGVAWSFPIELANVQYAIGIGLRTRTAANVSKNLNVRLDAIVNDTSSALLARAYLDPATRIAIVLGTGINAAIHLPIAALHPSKFALRKAKPDPQTTHVLTNTEFSMFGKGILPTSEWDDKLNAAHLMPDYQPLEYLIAGGYMGEIVRLTMVDAAETAGLYAAHLPPSLQTPYSLDTHTLALIEVDKSPSLSTTRSILQERHPSSHPPSLADANFIHSVVRSVTRRSRAYFATGMHALTSLLEDLDAEAGLSSELDHVSIGCDGSVINKYPEYMESVQDTLDQMRSREGAGRKTILLEKTQDGAVLGAGVAAALAGQIS